MAPSAPLTAGPNSSLSQRYGPAIITQELVAENGLFQPKLILTQKSPKLTPRPDPSEVYLSAQLRFRSGLPMGLEKWGRQLTTRRGKLGSQNWVILAA